VNLKELLGEDLMGEEGNLKAGRADENIL